MARQMSKGQCSLCGGTFGKSAMARHLKSCKQKRAGSEESSSGRASRKTQVFHIVVEGRHDPDYWMHLEASANAKLEAMDGFLRDIWLECCGHMSMFSIQDKRYSVVQMAEFDDESMTARLDEVLTPGMKFYHEYDFGSTTHLSLKVVSREAKQIKGKDIEVLARNEPPPIPCTSCGKMAAHVCCECVCSSEDGWLCDECAAEHECGEDMLLPVVNSPRVGVCGYTG